MDWNRTQAHPVAPRSAGEREEALRYYVFFTTAADTAADLRAAGELAQGLNARVTLLVAQEVPSPLPLSEPPVPVQVTEERLRALVQGAGLDASVQVYLCRDPWRAIRKVLPPASLVLIGGRRRAKTLASPLERDGHKVIFVERPAGVARALVRAVSKLVSTRLPRPSVAASAGAPSKKEFRDP